MKRLCRVIIALAAAYASPAVAQEPETETVNDFELTGEVTVITSDKLTFDYEKRFALFEDNVVVTDPELKLTCETMTVRFGEDNEVDTIIARNDVHIWQEDKLALSGLATYDVKTGKIVLEEKPRVKRGQDILTGDIITFWRDENKMVCEPRARLLIFPQEGGARTQLIGE